MANNKESETPQAKGERRVKAALAKLSEIETIKAHITRPQRELLLLMVNRRLNDILGHKWGMVRPEPNEAEDLKALKYELEQAGS